MTSKKLSNRLTNQLIRLVGDCIAPSGIGKGRLCIITYHRILENPDPLLEIEPDITTFRWQMELLADCFNVLPLHDAIQNLSNKRLPPRAVCITFDDGYRSTHDLAHPILKELNLPATVFVTTGYLGRENMWNDRIIEAIRQMPFGKYDLSGYGLGEYIIQSVQDRQHAIQKITAKSKYFQQKARLELVKELEKISGGTFTHDQMLTSEMVYSLSQQGIEIGGHTTTHPILTKLDDEDARNEIVSGKVTLEKIIGKPVRLFAYPNGKAGMDFDNRHVKMAKEAGFSAAFTTAIESASAQHDLYQLPRCSSWDSTPLFFGLRLLKWLA
jgi:peptidoglycan/xylan/chitin deacetylase (PgdA/CDA1 family)